jgi:hypothetical protein
VPTNITDPNGPSLSAFNYLRQETSWTLTQKLDNISASIGGDLGFGLPAGNIKFGISGDVRWATYDMESNALPTEFVNCTGLRMCLANGGAPVRWVQNTNAPVSADNSVWELAAETNIPAHRRHHRDPGSVSQPRRPLRQVLVVRRRLDVESGAPSGG